MMRQKYFGQAMSMMTRGLHVGCPLKRQQVDTATTSYPGGLSPSKMNQKDKILPFSHFLTDTHGRHHDYLRISISER